MFNCLKKDYSKPSKEYGSHGDGENFKPIWGYIVPHTKDAQGAETPDNKWSEYKHGQAVAVKNAVVIPWDDRDNGGVSGAVKRLVSKGVNATWEGHLNAYRGDTAGMEILYIHGDDLSKHYAELIIDAFRIRYPDRNIRGLKAKRKGDRGYNNLRDAKRSGADVALLGELFFIDNPDDYLSPDEVAEFILGVLA